MQVVGLWDHQPQEEDELGFKAGDVIDIVQVCNEDWLEGTLNGKRGFLPANRVQLLPAPSTEATTNNFVEGQSVAVESAVQVLADLDLQPTQEPSMEQTVQVLEQPSQEAQVELVAEPEPEPVQVDQLIVDRPLSQEPIPRQSTASTFEANNSNFQFSIDQLKEIPIDLIKKEGLLNVKANNNWKPFWGVLCPGILVLYKNVPSKTAGASKASTLIPLEAFEINQVSKQDTKKKNAFSLSVKNNKFLVYLESETEKNSWINALTENCLELFVDAVRFQAVKDRIFTSGDLRKKSVAKQSFTSKLTGFFRKTSVSSTDESELTFGGYLDKQYALLQPTELVPPIVERCIMAVEQRGLESEGIYRLSGQLALVNQIKDAFQQNKPIDLSDESLDINAVAGALKTYFRELKNPLIPHEHYNEFIDAFAIENYDDRMIQLKFLVHQLPLPNYNVLEYLLRHLDRVVQQSETNKMQTSNIGIVFGPTLMRPPGDHVNVTNMNTQSRIVEAMIEQVEWLFEAE